MVDQHTVSTLHVVCQFHGKNGEKVMGNWCFLIFILLQCYDVQAKWVDSSIEFESDGDDLDKYIYGMINSTIIVKVIMELDITTPVINRILIC